MALQRLPASGQDELQGGVAFRKERIIPDRIRKRGVKIHAPFFVSVESVGRTFGWRPAGNLLSAAAEAMPPGTNESNVSVD